jgi:glycosyltransferase involved in cell wall biosynthesis
MFSIVIPTWNNLQYLKLCVASVKKYSAYDHEIIVHVNEGTDGTLDWVKAQGLKHSHSRKNVGVCLAVNHLATQANREWLLFLNDDMVCCPGWDTALIASAGAVPNRLAMHFSTMIEPIDSGNPLVVVQDFGRTPGDFDEARMLADYKMQPRADVLTRGSQPTLVHRTWWNVVGGHSIEFGPGMSSDDDLLMKFWIIGCRSYRIVGESRVYHFAEKSTRRVRRNRGGRTFVMKWGITQQQFYRDYMAKAASHDGRAADFEIETDLPESTTLGRLKRIAYAFGNYPLGDLKAWDPAPGRYFTEL